MLLNQLALGPYWEDIGQVPFWKVMAINFQKKNETNIFPIWTEQASSIKDNYYCSLQICEQQRVFLLLSTHYKQSV